MKQANWAMEGTISLTSFPDRLLDNLPGSTRSVVRLYGKPKLTTARRALQDVLYVVSRPWQVLSDRIKVTGRAHQRHRSLGQHCLPLFNQVVILVWFGNRNFFNEPIAFRAHWHIATKIPGHQLHAPISQASSTASKYTCVPPPTSQPWRSTYPASWTPEVKA